MRWWWSLLVVVGVACGRPTADVSLPAEWSLGSGFTVPVERGSVDLELVNRGGVDATIESAQAGPGIVVAGFGFVDGEISHPADPVRLASADRILLAGERRRQVVAVEIDLAATTISIGDGGTSWTHHPLRLVVVGGGDRSVVVVDQVDVVSRIAELVSDAP